MKIIAVTNRKGGTGKTSVTMNLAAALSPRRSVAVVDLDPQQSATQWADWAEDLPFSVHPVNAGQGAAAFKTALDSLAEDADLLILDTPPELETPTQLALLVADLALVPTGVSALDLWATKEAVAAAQEARGVRDGKLPLVATVPNRLIARTKEVRELPGILKSMGEPIAPDLRNRIEVQRATIQGRTVNPRSQAGQEFEALARYVTRRLGRA